MNLYLKYFRHEEFKNEKYKYFKDKKETTEFYNVDFAIYNHECVLALSIYDDISKNKSIFKYFDFKKAIQSNGVRKLSLNDFDNKKFERIMNGKYIYKISKDNENSHVIFYKDGIFENCIIDWNNDGKIECIKKYLINNLQIPITTEILLKIFGKKINNEYYMGVGEYAIYSTINEYKNVKCYYIEDGEQILKAVRDNNFKTNLIHNHNVQWDKIKTLNDYVIEFNQELLDVLKSNTSIRFNPLEDLPDMNMFKYKRMPFKGQIPLIESAKRTLNDLDYVIVTAQMATGKTFIGTIVNDLYYSSKQKNDYLTLVVCPNISLKKWKREIEDTLNNVDVKIFERTTDFIKWQRNNTNLVKPTYILVSKETLKLSYSKKPSFVLRRDGLYCPHCGEKLVRKVKDEYISLFKEDFKTEKGYNHKCIRCNSVLWSAQYVKTAKTSIIEYCKRKHVHFDSCIIDEFHSAKSDTTIIGYAFANILKISKKKILLSGTMNNGLASSLFPLFMRLFPQKMVKEGYKINDIKKFIEEYGTMDTLTKIKTIDKWTEEKKENYKEKAGINPVIYTKFLSECCISATLDDLCVKMPNYSEIPIYVELEKEIINNVQEIMSIAYESARKTQNPMIIGAYKNSIARHYINNPYGWNDSGLTVDLKENKILNKEKALIQLIQRKLNEGKKCFVFTDFTGGNSKNQNGEVINDRLCRLLKQENIKSKCLKTNIKPIDREGHIKDNDNVEVWISNPILVKESLDLIEYPVLIFYNFGYEPMLISQASRRAYRPEQTQDCETYFFYTNYIEDEIIKSIVLKRMEMEAIEGKFDISDFKLVERTASTLGKQLYECINVEDSFNKLNEYQVNSKRIKLHPDVERLYQ